MADAHACAAHTHVSGTRGVVRQSCATATTSHRYSHTRELPAYPSLRELCSSIQQRFLYVTFSATAAVATLHKDQVHMIEWLHSPRRSSHPSTASTITECSTISITFLVSGTTCTSVTGTTCICLPSLSPVEIALCPLSHDGHLQSPDIHTHEHAAACHAQTSWEALTLLALQ